MFIKEILLEYNRQKTIDRIGQKILAYYKNDTVLVDRLVTNNKLDQDKLLQKILEIFENESDPTQNNQYVQWNIKQWLNGWFKVEDAPGVNHVLEWFYNNKQFLKSQNVEVDINRYDWETLLEIYNAFREDSSQHQSNKEIRREISDKMKSQSEILYNDVLGLLVVPKTEEASCFWGRGTRWCTASTDSQNYFDHYNQNGPLYIWLGADGSKYQFQFESRQFMDERDISLGSSEINQLRTKHPVISKLFKKYEDQLLKSKNISNIYDYAKTVIKGRWPEAEPVFVNDLNSAYMYAKDVIKSRWPAAEPLIIKDPEKAYMYAKDVIKGRWPEAEPLIIKDPELAYMYAAYVIHGRWLEAEPYIIKNPNVAYLYVKYVIEGRWPKAEPYIMKSPHNAYMYAKDVIKGRWPEAEPYIIKNPKVAYLYARDIIKGRWLEAEPYIMKASDVVYDYAKYVIKDSWPEAAKFHNDENVGRLSYADAIKVKKEKIVTNKYLNRR